MISKYTEIPQRIHTCSHLDVLQILHIILRGFTENTHSHPDPRDEVQRPNLKTYALEPIPLDDYPHPPLLLTFFNRPGFSPRSLASWTGTRGHSGVVSWAQEACVMHTWRGNSQLSLSKSCLSHLFSPLEGFENPKLNHKPLHQPSAASVSWTKLQFLGGTSW